MTCPKCAARMFPEVSLRFHASADYTLSAFDAGQECAGWHCLCCGQYVDRVVLANRAKQADERRLISQAELIATWTLIQPVAERVRG